MFYRRPVRMLALAVSAVVTSWYAPTPVFSADFWWRGDLNSDWNRLDSLVGTPINSNWATSITGTTDRLALPGPSDIVRFATTTTANLNTTFGVSITIDAITTDPTFTSSASVTGQTLTVRTGVISHLGSGSFTINANLATSGTTAYNPAAAAGSILTLNSDLSGNRVLSVTGGGLVRLGGNALMTGGTKVDAARLQVGTGGTSGTLAGNVSLVQNSTLTFARSNDYAFAGNVSGAGGVLEVNGAGILTLSGTNTYDGGTRITAGTLRLGSGRALPVGGDVTLAGAGLHLDVWSPTIGSLRVAGDSASRIIYDTGGVTQLTVQNDILWEGTSSFSGGPLSVRVPVEFTPGQHVVSNPNFGGSSSQYDVVFESEVRGSGDLSFPGSLDVAFTVPNSHTGLIRFGSNGFGGTLYLAAPNAIANAAGLVADGGLVSLSTPATASGVTAGNYDQTVRYLAGSFGIVDTGSATLTFGDSTNRSFGGFLAGDGQLVKTGTGTFTFTGTNVYAGITTVKGGTFRLGASKAFDQGGDLTLDGGMFDLAGRDATVGTLRFTRDAVQSSLVNSSGHPAGIVVEDDIQFTTTQPNAPTQVIDVPLLFFNPFSASRSISFPFVLQNSTTGYDVRLTRPISGFGTLTLGGSTRIGVAFEGSNSNYSGLVRVFPASRIALIGTNAIGGSASLFLSTNARADVTAPQTFRSLLTNGGSVLMFEQTTITTGDAGDQFVFGRLDGFNGSLIKRGSGRLVILGESYYTNRTQIDEGTLVISSNNALAQGADLVINNGSVLDLNGRNAVVRNLRIGTASTRNTVTDSSESRTGTLTINRDIYHDRIGVGTLPIVIDAPVSLTFGEHQIYASSGYTGQAAYDLIFARPVTGQGALILGGGLRVALAGPNTHLAPLLVNHPSATLFFGNSNAMSPNAALQIFSGTVSLSPPAAATGVAVGSHSQTALYLEGTGGSIQLGSATLTAGDASNRTFAGTLTGMPGGGRLNKVGTGTLALTGSSVADVRVSAGLVAFGTTSSATGGILTGSLLVDGGAGVEFRRSPAPDANTRWADGTFLVLLGSPSGGVATAAVSSSSAPVGGARTLLPSVGILNLIAIANSGGLSPVYYGSLFLNFNDAVIRPGGAPLTELTRMARAFITSGGTAGIGTSTDFAQYALAVFPNTTDVPGVPYFSTFDGVAVTAGDTLLRSTYIGDTDLSGTLDGRDLANALEGYSLGLTGWRNGDFDYDGVVSPADLSALLTLLATPGLAPLGSPADLAPPTGGAIPEPGHAALGLIALAPLSRRRRR